MQFILFSMDKTLDKSFMVKERHTTKQLVNAERQVLISKMLDLMTQGYHSTNKLSKECKVSRATIDRYRPIVDELIAKTKIDRNAIRALQIKRTYSILEQLMDDLKSAKTPKDRSLFYNQIYKFSSHLALITGLNVETQVHIDPTKLVIIRASQKAGKTRVSREDKIIDSTLSD